MSVVETHIELRDAVKLALTGKISPDAIERIREESTRIRERLQKVDLAVPLLRELREE